MPPAPDLGNQVLHHLMTSTKGVPAQGLYRKRVTVIRRLSDAAGIEFASFGINAIAAVVTAACHAGSFIKCSSVLLSTVSSLGHHVSHRFQHLRCYLFRFRSCPSVRASGFLCTSTPSSFSSCGRLVVHPLPSFVACPTMLAVPLKMVPWRFHLPVAPPPLTRLDIFRTHDGSLGIVLPCLGNHLMN